MKKNGRKVSAIVAGKGKTNVSSKVTNSLTQNINELTSLEERSTSHSVLRVNEQVLRKQNQDNQTDQIHSISFPSKLNEVNEADFLYKGSFQGPPYCIREIPEPGIRNEIIKSKISKLESYISLCEEFYLGNFSKTKSTSDLFQSLIVSHNINSKERLEALIKKESSNSSCNIGTKTNIKANSKNIPIIEPVKNAEEIISPLDLLLHPFRNKDTIDLWGPHEVILFECAICKYGKEFDKIQRIIKTKTTKEVVDFYYCVWKRTNRYRAWKHNRQLSDYIFS